MVGVMALLAVIAGLAATAWAQVRPLRRGRALFDALAIVPEWRFYAQASIRGAADLARDIHLVVRDRDAGGATGGWRDVLWHGERRWRDSVWNPELRTDDAILSIAEDLAQAWTPAGAPHVQQSIPYLVLLRRAIEADPATAAGIDRQFAIIHALGRGQRVVRTAFVSAWHRR